MNDIITEDRIREIIKEELSNFVPPKKKRSPNKWQIFLKDCVKNQPGEFSYTDKVKACSMEYKAGKNGNGQNDQSQSSQPASDIQENQNSQNQPN